MTERKGQGAMIFGLFWFVITMISLVLLFPILNTFLNFGISSADDNTKIVLQMIPFVLVIVIVAYYMNKPSREPGGLQNY